MDTLNLKRPVQEFGKFKYFKNNKGVYEGKENLEEIKSNKPQSRLPQKKQISQIAYPELQSSITSKSKENFNNKVLSIISKLKSITPVQSTNLSEEYNSKYQELSQQIKEIQISREQISNIMTRAREEQALAQKRFEDELAEIQMKIVASKTAKAMIEERNKGERRVLKFYKDFTNLEILEVLEAPSGMMARIRHENHYIEFKLVKLNNTYEYCLHSTSIDAQRMPEVFKEEIAFEKSEFKGFYLEMIEMLISFE